MTRSQRFVAWLSSNAMVFPVVILIVAGLSLFTKSPSVSIVIGLIIAILPWVLVAVEVSIPPMVVVIVTTLAIAALVLRYDNSGAMFIAVVAISWAASQGLRASTIVGLAGNTGVVVIAAFTGHDAFHHAGMANWLMGLAMGWFLGLLVNRQRQLTDDLSEARHELSLAAIRHERTLVAREVHDIVGHGLTVALLNITGARRQLSKNPAAATEALDRAELVTRDSLETVRNVVGLLSSDNQRFEPMPGGGDVRALVEQAQRSGLPVSLDLTGDPAELEPAVGLTLIRLLQESLSNASRHAPGARIDVSLTVARTNVTAVVSNAMPRSADSADVTGRHGLGVASMTDRVAAIRGTLDVGRRDDRWLVRCVLPRTVRPVHGSTTSPS